MPLPVTHAARRSNASDSSANCHMKFLRSNAPSNQCSQDLLTEVSQNHYHKLSPRRPGQSCHIVPDLCFSYRAITGLTDTWVLGNLIRPLLTKYFCGVQSSEQGTDLTKIDSAVQAPHRASQQTTQSSNASRPTRGEQTRHWQRKESKQEGLCAASQPARGSQSGRAIRAKTSKLVLEQQIQIGQPTQLRGKQPKHHLKFYELIKLQTELTRQECFDLLDSMRVSIGEGRSRFSRAPHFLQVVDLVSLDREASSSSQSISKTYYQT